MRLAVFIVAFAAASCLPHVSRHVDGLSQHALPPAPPGWAADAPRNVILFIGDGMGPAQVHAAATANGGHLHLDRFPVIGQSRTASGDHWITDSAAAATAMATGFKTHNGYLGVDSDGAPRPTLLEIAEAEGRSTGVIATSSITHATPAAFVAHQVDRQDHEAVAEAYVGSPVDVAFGGGRAYFAKRADGRDLVAEWTAGGTTVVDSLDAAVAVEGPVAVLAAPHGLPPVGDRGEAWLTDAALAAVRRLDADPDGFFLMIEGSQIDWGAHANDARWMAGELLDFDRAVGAVLDWAAARGDTLVVVTADHETGGFAIVEGDPDEGAFTGRFHTREHTPVPVTVYAWGPGAERFVGVYENTGIFDRIRAAWAPAVDEILTEP